MTPLSTLITAFLAGVFFVILLIVMLIGWMVYRARRLLGREPYRWDTDHIRGRR